MTIFQDITYSEDAKTRYKFSTVSVAQEIAFAISRLGIGCNFCLQLDSFPGARFINAGNYIW